MVLSGDNMNTGLFLGMLAGAEAAGKPVDLVVGSCGGSIAAALTQILPSNEERLALILSPEFHQVLREIDLADPSLTQVLGRVLRLRRNAAALQLPPYLFLRNFPHDLFSYGLIHPDRAFARLDARFSGGFSGALPIKAVIIGARADFDEGMLRQGFVGNPKLFTETYFTDAATAAYLQGFPSLVGSTMPASLIRAETAVNIEATLLEAVRASIADPLLVPPAEIAGRRYFTGAVNIDPVNVGRYLAQEVIGRYPGLYDPVFENSVLQGVFGFDGNQVRKSVLGGPNGDYWVDMSSDDDYRSFSPGAAFSPGHALRNINLARIARFATGVPVDYEDYRSAVLSQYEAGKRRVTEALMQPRHSTAHIRRPVN